MVYGIFIIMATATTWPCNCIDITVGQNLKLIMTVIMIRFYITIRLQLTQQVQK